MQTVDLNKGDMLVLKTDQMLTPEIRKGLQEGFDAAIEKAESGKTVAIILECGIDFEVVNVKCNQES